jgi:tRNA-splicing ligase RtcB (3'-phosphate/5'-hydroxy nucleic acid ligase)
MSRRPDPYETRARELAAAQGLDPDSRVPHASDPDRTQPAWVGFRKAAREEHLAREAAEIVLPEQDSRYRGVRHA